MLCDICQGIFPTLTRDYNTLESTKHHAKAISLQRSSQAGCRICAYIWQQMNVEEQQSFLYANASESTGFTNYSASPSPASYEMDFDNENLISNHTFSLEFSLVDEISTIAVFTVEPVSDVEELIELNNLHSSTGSSSDLSQAYQWLSHCVTYHNHHNSNDPWKSPTRVIEIGTGDQDPRLILTENLPLDGGYITLSHCWGKVLFMKLELGNLEKFCQAIPFGDLPQTFQHAIIVAKALQVRYLWIDALCIIQDSIEDWTKESATMAKVYQKAVCNIAASDSTNSSGGLFFERQNDNMIPSKIICLCDGVPDKQFFLSNGEPMWRKELEKAPLYRRAWVLQEQLLAPRTLHFTKEGIAWECHDLTATKIYPTGLHSMRLDSTIIHLRELISRSETLALIKEDSKIIEPSCLPIDQGDFLRDWSLIVELYTHCNLTFSRDKLVAISGVTQNFYSLLGEHLAGLWRYYLPYEFLWFVDPNLADTAVRPSEYRAPSWSWASVDGPVTYDMVKISFGHFEHGEQPLVKVINCEVYDKPGSMAEVSVEGHLGACGWRTLFGSTATITGVIDICEHDQPLKVEGNHSDDDWSDVYIYIDEAGRVETMERDKMPIFCLPVSGRDLLENGTSINGLVLCQDENSQFTRVGIFTSANNTAYLAMKGLKSHTIKIV